MYCLFGGKMKLILFVYIYIELEYIVFVVVGKYRKKLIELGWIEWLENIVLLCLNYIERL